MTRQRRFLKAERKAGFVSTVSTRALMHELPILVSLAQLGIKHQRAWKNSRSSPFRMHSTFCVGATLYAGVQSSSNVRATANTSANSRGFVKRLNRPHI